MAPTPQGVVGRDRSRAVADFPELWLVEFVSGERSAAADSRNGQAGAAVQAMWPQRQKRSSDVRAVYRVTSVGSNGQRGRACRRRASRGSLFC